MDCIFCKIAERKMPAHIVYESDNFIAFLDISPVNLGHSLLIPKKHSKNIFEIDEDTLKGLGPELKKVAEAVKKGVCADGVNIIMNNEPAAGQIVFHSHIHIIPRLSNDGFTHWKGEKCNPESFSEVAEKISRAF